MHHTYWYVNCTKRQNLALQPCSLHQETQPYTTTTLSAPSVPPQHRRVDYQTLTGACALPLTAFAAAANDVDERLHELVVVVTSVRRLRGRQQDTVQQLLTYTCIIACKPC